MDIPSDVSPPVALPFDPVDPVVAFAPLAGQQGAMLLDGAAGNGAYSYIVAEPLAWLEADTAGTRLDGMPQNGSPDPFAALEQLATRLRHPALPGLPPFQGGVVGLLGYELGGVLERLPPPRSAGDRLPDLAAGLYDTVAAWDHRVGRAWVLAPTRAQAQAFRDRLGRTAPPLAEGRLPITRLLAEPGWRAELAPAAYRAAVARILEYIRAGDIYQANMTQRFLGRLAPGGTAWDCYRALRPRTAGPFGAFLDLGEGRALASGSPERFLALDADGRVETRPIKGTRPRGATPAEDAALARALLDSEKDRAENLMIVDLLRNDLSRVSRIGSVKVPQLCGLESFRAVHHLVSAVTARLRPGLGPVDLLRAAFPGGSITGAPKIRAMEIIRELEPARRGPYCGSVVWIGADGAMDSSIIIRSLCIADGQVVAQAGGGIVADSEPEAEWQESLTKARALLTALDPGMVWPPATMPADSEGRAAA